MSSSAPRAALVLTTIAAEADGAAFARTLVEEQLAACVNLMPVRSIYRWQGKLEDDGETLAIIKTTRERYDDLATRLRALHPYEVPEILVLPIADGGASYLAWLEESTRA